LPQILILSKSSRETGGLIAELNRHNFSCHTVNNADNALQQVNIHLPDLVLVEVSDTQENELFYRYLRDEKKLPVLAITSIETAINLDGTVDDFVLSPFNIVEIIIRIKRLLKKKGIISGPETIKAGSLNIDTVKYEVYVSGRPVSLTFREYELLKFLASNPGRVFTRDALLNGVWGEDFFGGDRTVDVHIRRLRGKIEDETNNYIETVRNIGYRFLKKS
jgi:two-component system alkaline phosphatase synthesis response regulator PhoP